MKPYSKMTFSEIMREARNPSLLVSYGFPPQLVERLIQEIERLQTIAERKEASDE